MNRVRPIDILLVEDSPADVRLTREALKEAKVLNALHVVQDGAAALAFLRRQGQYASSPSPDLILLDLNLPKKDGREVLAEIKQDEALKRIPVVVLTTSRAEEDIVRSYDLHARPTDQLSCRAFRQRRHARRASGVDGVSRRSFTSQTHRKGVDSQRETCFRWTACRDHSSRGE